MSGLYAASLLVLAALPVSCPVVIAEEPVPVRGVEVEGTAFRVTLSDGRIVPHEQLPGTILALGDGSGAQRRIRIDGVERDAKDPAGEIVLYALSEQDAGTGEWRNLCLPDAEGKCVRFGYKPWSFGPIHVSLAPYYQACVRLVRADYCGDGIGHTRDGTPIDIFDAIGIQRDEPAPGMTFEAAWQADGAVCVRHTRLPDVFDGVALAAQCPRLKHSIGETCDEAAPALLYNRSFSH